jgi:hypothetical protein
MLWLLVAALEMPQRLLQARELRQPYCTAMRQALRRLGRYHYLLMYLAISRLPTLIAERLHQARRFGEATALGQPLLAAVLLAL